MPSVPEGNDDGVVMISGTAMSRKRTFCEENAGLLLSVTLIVKLEVPIPVGVPAIVAPASDKPAGNDPDTRDQL